MKRRKIKAERERGKEEERIVGRVGKAAWGVSGAARAQPFPEKRTPSAKNGKGGENKEQKRLSLITNIITI